MSSELTRDAVREQIDRFADGALSPEALAAWAFDQFYHEAEGVITYEQGSEDAIEAVLDELMWMDSAPFRLDQGAVQQLRQRLEENSSQKSEAGGSTHDA